MNLGINQLRQQDKFTELLNKEKELQLKISSIRNLEKTNRETYSNLFQIESRKIEILSFIIVSTAFATLMLLVYKHVTATIILASIFVLSLVIAFYQQSKYSSSSIKKDKTRKEEETLKIESSKIREEIVKIRETKLGVPDLTGFLDRDNNKFFILTDKIFKNREKVLFNEIAEALNTQLNFYKKEDENDNLFLNISYLKLDNRVDMIINKMFNEFLPSDLISELTRISELLRDEYNLYNEPLSEIGEIYDSIRRTNPYEFEEEIANLFNKLGFRALVTKGSGDKGIDIVMYNSDYEKFLVQCKQYKGYVSPGVIRELIGTVNIEGAKGGYLVTSGKFSKESITLAKQNNIILLDDEEIKHLIKKSVLEDKRVIEK